MSADLPPGPWTWEPHVDALVAADGTRLVGSEDGGDRVWVHPALRELLPLLAPDVADLDGAVVEAEVAVGLLAEVRRLTAERDQARSLAWSYEHREFDYRAMGIELDEAGEPLEPAWLSAPFAPHEAVLIADLASFSTSGEWTVRGRQASGLAIDDCAWVRDASDGTGEAADQPLDRGADGAVAV